MKSSMKRILAILVLTLLSNALTSATVKWLVKPSYDRIEVFSENIFSCFLDGKIQLYTTSGNPLLPYPCDSVTHFSDGYALVLDRGSDASRWKIKGIVSESELQFTEIQRGYYTMLYSYFSEGLLAVGNAEGKYGYLDPSGRETIPCRYKKARPFIKGRAAVQLEDNRVVYINDQGQPMRINFHHGEVNDGTSFNQNGEAVVIHYKSKDMAVINEKGEVIRKYKQPKGVKKFYRDYDRSFCEDCEEISAPENKMPQYDSSISTFTSGDRFGYKLSRTTTIPAQFTYAGPFANRCAVVGQGNRYGIIALVDGDLSCSLKEGDDITINPYKKVPTLTYQLEVPAGLTSIQVKFDRGDGVMSTVKLTSNSYSFKPFVNKNTKSCTIRSEVYSDGLLLLEDEIELNVQQNASPLTVGTPSSTSERANSKDIQTVKAMVTNNSEASALVVVTFSAAFQANSPNHFVNETFEETLAPGETKEFSASIVVKQFENAKVTVKASTNNKPKSSSATIKLTPYDY